MPSYTVIGVVVITIICLLLGYEFVSFDKQAFEGEDVEFPQPRVRTTSKPSNLTLTVKALKFNSNLAPN